MASSSSLNCIQDSKTMKFSIYNEFHAIHLVYSIVSRCITSTDKGIYPIQAQLGCMSRNNPDGVVIYIITLQHLQ